MDKLNAIGLDIEDISGDICGMHTDISDFNKNSISYDGDTGQEALDKVVEDDMTFKGVNNQVISLR